MKILVLAICVCAAAAVPQLRPSAAKPYSGDERAAEVLRFASDVQPNGYSYSFETSNGISAQENGELKKVADVEAVVAQGSFQYSAPDGQQIQLTYVADENGYQPSGNVLPTPPPTPDHVVRLLDFIAKHPPPPETPTAYKRTF